MGARLIRLRHPRRRRDDSRGRTEIQVGDPFVRLGVIVVVRTEEHVVEPVPVDIAGGGDGAETAIRLVTLEDPHIQFAEGEARRRQGSRISDGVGRDAEREEKDADPDEGAHASSRWDEA